MYIANLNFDDLAFAGLFAAPVFKSMSYALLATVLLGNNQKNGW